MTETCTKEFHTIELNCDEVIILKEIFFLIFNNYESKDGKTFLELQLNRKNIEKESSEGVLLTFYDNLEKILKHSKKECFSFKTKIHFLELSCLEACILKMWFLEYLKKTKFQIDENGQDISFLELSVSRSEISSSSHFIYLLSLVDKLKEVFEHENL